MTEQEQLGREGLRALDPREVRDALREGRLTALLTGCSPEPQAPLLTVDEVESAYRAGTLGELLKRRREWQPGTRERLRTMTPEQARDALRDGELDDVLKGDGSADPRSAARSLGRGRRPLPLRRSARAPWIAQPRGCGGGALEGSPLPTGDGVGGTTRRRPQDRRGQELAVRPGFQDAPLRR
jgi:hypothetical protein